MKLNDIEFTPRSGTTGYCLDYDPACVTQMSNGAIRLALPNGPLSVQRSAGIMGPVIGYKPLRVKFSGRPDQMDPNTVWSIWTYDDATGDEIDLFEFTRWGDQNQPGNLSIGGYLNGKREGLAPPLILAPTRAFNNWIAYLDIIAYDVFVGAVIEVRIYGWWVHDGKQEWKEVAKWRTPLPKDFVMGQLRAAMWLSKEGFKYASVADRGNRLMQINSVTHY